MKKKPEKPKVTLKGSTLSIFAAPSQKLPEKPVETPAIKKTAETPGTFWELFHDADLRAVTDRWPPKAGASELKVEITASDGGNGFKGTVAYRTAKSEKSSTAWQPMTKAGEDKSGSVFFEASLALSKGTVFIQFRVCGAGEKEYGKEFIDLTDWEIGVE
jgi:hypothetical protein